MPITFVDAGVLIAAAQGINAVSARAIALLDDPNRSFASSEFIRLEVLPKAIFNRKLSEAEFYTEFFGAVSYWPGSLEGVVAHAYELAIEFGLAAMDALHLAAAVAVGAEEFFTTEKRTKALHPVTTIRVRSIQSE